MVVYGKGLGRQVEPASRVTCPLIAKPTPMTSNRSNKNHRCSASLIQTSILSPLPPTGPNLHPHRMWRSPGPTTTNYPPDSGYRPVLQPAAASFSAKRPGLHNLSAADRFRTPRRRNPDAVLRSATDPLISLQ